MRSSVPESTSVRGSWNLHLRSDKRIEDLSRMFNPVVRGWLQYYGRFYRSALYPPMRQLDRSLARWAIEEVPLFPSLWTLRKKFQTLRKRAQHRRHAERQTQELTRDEIRLKYKKLRGYLRRATH